MNAIEGSVISKIHVTLEDGFSYASFEAVGYDFRFVNLTDLLERVLSCFQPNKFSIALHADAVAEELGADLSLDVKGYYCSERSYDDVGKAGSIAYHSFNRAADGCGSPKSILHCWWAEEEDGDEGVKN